MNSTCRGEGERLNCKTRRHRRVCVKSLRLKAVLFGGRWEVCVCVCSKCVCVCVCVFALQLAHRCAKTKHMHEQTRSISNILTGVITETLSLLPPPVQPDAKTHEDDPACTADAGDESRLLDHVRDLLGDAVVLVPGHDYFSEVPSYRHTDTHVDVCAI